MQTADSKADIGIRGLISEMQESILMANLTWMHRSKQLNDFDSDQRINW